MNPRPYQQEDLVNIEQNYLAGRNRQLYHAATGLGKGVVAAAFIPDRFPRLMEEGMLIMVPRREIAFQMRDDVREQHPAYSVGLEMGQSYATGDEDVLIMSSHTAGRRESDRIERFMRDYGILVNDEAHHTYSGGSADNVLQWFGQGADMNESLPSGIDPLVLHTTATPKREDEHSLAPFVDTVSASRDIEFGIRRGWLVDIDARKVIENPGQTVDDMDGYEADLIARIYEDFGTGDRYLAFASTVDVARLAHERLHSRGTPAGFVSGDECRINGEDAERNEVIDAHQSGDIRVVTNYGVLVEGYNDPSLRGLIMARDLASERLYTQILGRVLRPDAPVDAADSQEERKTVIAESNKPDARVIDVGCNVESLDLQTTAPDVVGAGEEVHRTIGGDEERVVEVVTVIDELDEEQPERDLRDADPESIDLAVKGVDVWSKTVYNDRLRSFSPLRWIVWDEPEHLALYIPHEPEDSSYRQDRRNQIVYLEPNGDGDMYRVLKIITGGAVKSRNGWHGSRADADLITTIRKEQLHEYTRAIEQRLRQKGLDRLIHRRGGPKSNRPATNEQLDSLADAGFSVNEGEVTRETANILLDYHKTVRKIGRIRSEEDGTNKAKKLLN